MALGDNMLAKGLITKEQLEKALKEKEASPGEKLGEILVRLGYATVAQVVSCL